MKTDAELIRAVGQLVKRDGEAVALAKICIEGVGAQTAEALVKGRYKKRMSSLLRAALYRALDVVSEERAS